MSTMHYVLLHMLQEKYPNITPFQVLFVRASFAFFIILLYVNQNAKRYLFDCIRPEEETPLVFRSIQQTFSAIISTIAAFRIDPAISAGFENLAPFFLLLFAVRVLNEKVEFLRDFVPVLISYGFLMMTKFGIERPQHENCALLTCWPLYLFVVLNPALNAAGQVAMKKMSGLPALAVVFWN